MTSDWKARPFNKAPDAPNEIHGDKVAKEFGFKGEPQPLAHNVACLDYSVAKEGKLVAYRWQGEGALTKENFTYVNLAN